MRDMEKVITFLRDMYIDDANIVIEGSGMFQASYPYITIDVVLKNNKHISIVDSFSMDEIKKIIICNQSKNTNLVIDRKDIEKISYSEKTNRIYCGRNSILVSRNKKFKKQDYGKLYYI